MNINKNFYKELGKIAIPITIQYFIGSSLNLIDTIMVGQLGDNAIASVGISNQIFIILNLFLLGISGGCSIFATQFFGKNDIKSINKIFGLGLMLSIGISTLYFILVRSLPNTLLSFFTNDKEVIYIGELYLKTVCYSYVITSITVITSTISRSMQIVKIPMLASIIAIFLNTIGNYILIFGNLGFPALGVKGAAIATIIARSVELILLFILLFFKKDRIIPPIKELLSFSKNLYKKFMEQTLVLILKDVAFGIGMAVFIGIYARIGTDAIAAVNIVNTVQNMAFVFLSGIGQASIIMIGKQLGKDNKEIAYLYAKRFQKLSIIIGIVLGLAILLSRNIIMKPFNLSSSATSNVYNLLTVTSFLFMFLGYNMISVVGILRSGGDNKFCLIMDIIAIWIIGIPLALISGFILKYPIAIVVAINSIKDIYKTIHLTIRIRSKKWLKNIVDGI